MLQSWPALLCLGGPRRPKPEGRAQVAAGQLPSDEDDKGPMLGVETEDTGLFTLCLETDAGDCF